MTDDQPRERPDFVPPEGDAGLDRLGAPHPPPGSPVPGPPFLVPPVPGPPVPVPPVPGTPVPPPPTAIPPRQVILPPGPYKHPYQPPHPPSREGKGSVLLGIAITFVTLALALWLSTSIPYDNPLSDVTSGAILVAPVALIVVGIILSAIQRTTRTGAGMLLGLGGIILIAGGLCVALLAQFSG